LSFPEFEGIDPDGWIRKAEKYFELVGVANEDRVQLVVLYIKGKAEYWWRSTGSVPAYVPWHTFCRMVSYRFSDASTYEVVGKFHTLKQLGSVTNYIDKFEEFMGLVKRDNPSLRDDYFTLSFVSGLKEPIQHHLQCYKPTSLTDAFWFAKRLEQATPPPRKFSNFAPATKIQKPWVKDGTPVEQKDPVPIAELRAAGKCFKCRFLGYQATPKCVKGNKCILLL
jgi:hypothetical protein